MIYLLLRFIVWVELVFIKPFIDKGFGRIRLTFVSSKNLTTQCGFRHRNTILTIAKLEELAWTATIKQAARVWTH